MPKKVVDALNDPKIRALKPTQIEQKICDGGNLYLIVSKKYLDNNGKETCTKKWRFDYSKPKGGRDSLYFGTYPIVSLADARKMCIDAKTKIKSGIDPKEEIKQAQAKIKAATENQFHTITIKFFTTKYKHDVSRITYTKIYRAIERDVLPFFVLEKTNNDEITFNNVITSRGINTITKNEIIDIIKQKAKTANETSRRLFGIVKDIFMFANIEILENVAIGRYLPKLDKSKHRASTVDREKIRQILNFIDNYSGSIVVKTALRLLPYVFVRSGNLTAMKWCDIDFQAQIWTVTEHKTVDIIGTAYLPLSLQAINIIKSMQSLTGDCEYIFPQTSNRIDPSKNFIAPMTTNSLSKVFRDNGFQGIITPHGFRAMFKSIAQTHYPEHGMTWQAIEASLFHSTEKNDVGESYGHMSDYTSQIAQLMNWWANYLDKIKTNTI